MVVLGAGLIGCLAGVIMPGQMKSPPALGGISVVALGGAIFFMLKIKGNALERRKYRLGFDGERHTAQAILPLIGGGYSIFHDFPGRTADGTRFSIEHVLVGPAGAIIIETKAWSKNAELKTKESAVVRYDGQKLQFPGCSDSRCLDQAMANAKYPGEELTRETGERVRVRAAVCLPGCSVPDGKEYQPHVAIRRCCSMGAESAADRSGCEAA